MTKKIYTSCTLDCPDGCGIIAHVDNGRVVKLEGHPDHEFTKGYLCAKTYRFPKRLYSPERQLHPLKRANGSIDSLWVPIGWDEALDLVADRIRRFKAETGSLSIMHYQRTGSWGVTKKLNHRFWNLMGGVTTPSGSLCSGAARAGQKLDFGIRLGHDPSDIVNSKLVLLWGRKANQRRSAIGTSSRASQRTPHLRLLWPRSSWKRAWRIRITSNVTPTGSQNSVLSSIPIRSNRSATVADWRSTNCGSWRANTQQRSRRPSSSDGD